MGRGVSPVGALRKVPRDIAVDVAALCHCPPWPGPWDCAGASSVPCRHVQVFAQLAGALPVLVFAETGQRRHGPCSLELAEETIRRTVKGSVT